LPAFVFLAGITLGSLALVMLHHMTGGAWGMMTRRLHEGATRTLPLVALMFVPIALGLRYLYVWSDPVATQRDAALRTVVEAKHLYLNTGFFLVRAVLYFAVWMLFVHFLNRWSLEQDRRPPRATIAASG